MSHQAVTESLERFAKLQKLWNKLTRPIFILLVEDDVHDVALIKNRLKGHRVELTVASTGSEAITLLDQKEYDLCLLDLKLFGVSGVEVLRWAKERKKTVPFIALTGLGDGSPMIKEALDIGVECVIQKPLTPEKAKMILGSA
jgi:DNA-binding response OmpR family regulator